MDISIFLELAAIFSRNGHDLYMIGGTSRDYLLGRNSSDYDFVTDATPFDMQLFLPEVDMTFSRFGSVKYKFKEKSIDIVTLREEEGYEDSRHPSKIRFIKELAKDHERRDFTINAIYIDNNLQPHDFCHGLEDLKAGRIRMIGDARKRIKEDPLRIFRAIRFKLMLDFVLDKDLEKAILESRNEPVNLNPQKIAEELRKINGVDPQKFMEEIKRYRLEEFIEMK